MGARLVEVFRELRRVLRDDGTLWLEIGDSYANRARGNHEGGAGQRRTPHGEALHGGWRRDGARRRDGEGNRG